MKNVPHWKWLIVGYAIMVAIPIYLAHIYLKKRAYENRTFGNLALYFFGVIGVGFTMHYLCLWLYFTFFFEVIV